MWEFCEELSRQLLSEEDDFGLDGGFIARVAVINPPLFDCFVKLLSAHVFSAFRTLSPFKASMSLAHLFLWYSSFFLKVVNVLGKIAFK
jgi:hypothetical protein